MSSLPSVYFDESGSTGDWRLDPVQPFFAMAGVRFSPEEEAAAFACFEKVKLSELKFAKLRKSGASQRAVRALFKQDFVSRATASVYLVNHPHMVVAKYCDLVIGPSMENAGLDFYANGMNLAISNLLAMTLPVRLGAARWVEFLRLFVKCVRSKSEADFNEWKMLSLHIVESLKSEGEQELPWVIPILQIQSSRFLATIAKSELNPALPSFAFLLDHWGKIIGGRFEAVCDESKSLDEQKLLLDSLSDAQLAQIESGYDRRKMSLPLPMTKLRFADSKQERQIQLADVFAGAVAGGLRNRKSGTEDGFESDMLDILAEKKIIVGGIWPTRDLSPKDLGTLIKE
ncbi:MAG: DUF3800 domain-containing protein [Proteobacteria bacterium]|nr:MAG: DUF3800 domain-containing protein [Pseudomonadota bacterium]